ncbi:DNA repair protein RecO [Schleiferia thermophila]|jgi:DNA repair protein RecO (recombination protein O)|uniref:DNA replication and repair protein RecO n=1 Tax=Schleiferia thermophila TaxID=884107 RepID=A0A369AA17_9FLAO|nr:recombination protein O N-terminal domain-containing protein [Schleiferia thermophila]KFD39569.1 hypothetical protein AT05_04355 [Schleiferia thermophila str. Yellowstone]RCX04937.1 DNA replication and repair protein RecO [Schleiferia thermophila]GCD79542.1 hypothetical protein JCM30197_07890 [Schleiferia thermophila]
MLRSLNAIVLSSVPVGSGGVVIRTFTDLEGKLSFLVRGLHSKNAIFKPSYLQPLVVLKVSADIRANRQLHYIRDATIEPAPQSLFTNPSTRALSFFVAEVLQRSLHDFQPLKPLFEFTVTWIGQLDQYKGAQGYRVLWYLSELIKILGIAPRILPHHAWLDLAEGISTAVEPSHPYKSPPQITELLHTLFNQPDEQFITQSSGFKSELLDVLLLYLRLHIPGFGEPKSLNVLKYIFL